MPRVCALCVIGTPLQPLLWLIAVPAWAALLLAAVTRRRQALHDLVVGSVVVKARELDKRLSNPPRKTGKKARATRAQATIREWLAKR